MYYNIPHKERFIKAITLLNNPDLAERFMRDILTEKEMETCVNRLTAMCLLRDAAPYSNIHTITGLSPNTIARLSKRVYDIDSGVYEIIEKFLEEGPAYSE